MLVVLLWRRIFECCLNTCCSCAIVRLLPVGEESVGEEMPLL